MNSQPESLKVQELQAKIKELTRKNKELMHEIQNKNE